jgi:transcriptional regulator with XRE-family HTH domain
MENILKNNIENFIIKEKVNASIISKRSGVSVSTLSRILSGEIKSPSNSTIEQLSKLFGIPVSKLISTDLYEDKCKDEEINHQNIKERVLYLMKKSRLNIDSLVGMTNISHGAIRAIILGETKKPNLETCTKLADFFGITVKQLKCEDPLEVDDDLYKEVPIIDIKNIKAWTETNSDNYITSFKSFLLKSNKKLFCIEVKDDSFIFEYESGDRLIFESTNEINVGKYIAEICGTLNIYHIYNLDHIIKYRVIGSTNKLTTEKNNIKIFGKLLEVKVN